MALTTGQKVLVKDRPEEIVEAIQAWRSQIIAKALPATPRRRSEAPLSLVNATAGALPPNHNQEIEDR